MVGHNNNILRLLNATKIFVVERLLRFLSLSCFNGSLGNTCESAYELKKPSSPPPKNVRIVASANDTRRRPVPLSPPAVVSHKRGSPTPNYKGFEIHKAEWNVSQKHIGVNLKADFSLKQKAHPWLPNFWEEFGAVYTRPRAA